MYTPNAPPNTGAHPPPYSEYPAPGVGQPQEIAFAGYPPQSNFPPYQQPAYPQPHPQPYPQPYPPTGQQQYLPPTQQPVTAQPGGEGWMPFQQGSQNPNCPPGLEYLTAIDQLLVHQKVELLEAITGFETANKYTVKNAMGQKVFNAKEKSDCCSRNLCGPNRPFDMTIVDNNDHEVIHLNRPLACSSCLFPCCLQNMVVTAPPGTIIGSIQQDWSILKPNFSIKDASGETVLTIVGPLCTFSFCGDVEFKIYSKDGTTKIGKISKQWSGLLREAFTDADMFGINFPLDLDVKIKAVLLGACFLIDFMFFEKSGNQENDRPGML